MTLSEIAQLLKACAQADPMFTFSEDKAAAWTAIIPEQVTLEAGMKAVVQHYRVETRQMMPADVVAFWKRYRESVQNHVQNHVQGDCVEATEMPESFKQKMRKIGLMP